MSGKIKLLVMDVDGVLTGGELPYFAAGNKFKTFHVQDGLAIRLWIEAGGAAAIISGRESPAVVTRARDLGISFVEQGVTKKGSAFEAACREFGVVPSEAAVIGDDLPELSLMRRCGYPIAVANAAAVVKRAARYVTRRSGGAGGVAEAIERLLRHNGSWPEVMTRWQA